GRRHVRGAVRIPVRGADAAGAPAWLASAIGAGDGLTSPARRPVARTSEAHPGLFGCRAGPGCGLRPYPGYMAAGAPARLASAIGASAGLTSPARRPVARISEAHPGLFSDVARAPGAAFGLTRATWLPARLLGWRPQSAQATA